MMMIIRSLVNIITTHPHEYIKKNLFGQILSTENLCYTLLQPYPGDNLNPATRCIYHHKHTHTLTISNSNLMHTNTHTHT